jgi:hypothetical protein
LATTCTSLYAQEGNSYPKLGIGHFVRRS